MKARVAQTEAKVETAQTTSKHRTAEVYSLLDVGNENKLTKLQVYLCSRKHTRYANGSVRMNQWHLLKRQRCQVMNSC